MQKFRMNQFDFTRKMDETRIFFAFQRRPQCENISTDCTNNQKQTVIHVKPRMSYTSILLIILLFLNWLL